MLAWFGGAAIAVRLRRLGRPRYAVAQLKLLGQLLAIGCVVFLGDAEIATFTLTERIALPAWFAVPFTFAFLLGATNAVNLSDGLDGLAGGTTCWLRGAGVLGSPTAWHRWR